MMIVRPVQTSDLPDLLNLADRAQVGLTTLPSDRDRLERKVVDSVAAFDAERKEAGNDAYLFVLQDTRTGAVVGTSSIIAAVGLSEAFYSYKLGTTVHASRELNVYNKVSTLYLTNDCTGCTELCTLFLHPGCRKDYNGKLLSKSRFLFMALFPHRFSSRVIAEMRGFCDEHGHSPFWEGLGRHFFSMDFSDADFLSGIGNKSFIAELMPRHPVYVNLLDEQARNAIGKVHSGTVPALKMLEKEGFNFQGYVDIFDAGPTLEAHFQTIRTIHNCRSLSLVHGKESQKGEPHLVSNTRRQGFRCCVTDLPKIRGKEIKLKLPVAESLNVTSGDKVCAAPLT